MEHRDARTSGAAGGAGDTSSTRFASAARPRREYPMAISMLDEALESPHIADEDAVSSVSGSDWRWASVDTPPPPRHRRRETVAGRQNDSPFPPAPAQANDRSAASIAGRSPTRTNTPSGSIRRSMSPRMRADSVMEKIMNPHLDRESDLLQSPPLLSLPTAVRPQHQPPPDPFHHRDRSNSSYIKAAAFNDATHSVYVATYPRGVRGLAVLLQSPMLLLAIGLFSGSVGLFIDFWLAKIADYHNALTDAGFRFFVASAIAASSFAVVLVHCVCPQAAGSGLPFMRVAISGIDMAPYLTLRCVVVKIVGLLAAFTAGLSIGKEGPFIMIACGFASLLMAHVPMFSRIRNDDSKRLEMLACACAAGVAATFGSPFGGILFGVEVTSHFYLVQTLPRSFFAAIVGALLVNFVTQHAQYGLFASSTLGIDGDDEREQQRDGSSSARALHVRDLAVVATLGVTCGLGGALFNHCIAALVRARDHLLEPSTQRPAPLNSMTARLRAAVLSGLGKRLLLVATVTFVSCFLEFYGDSAWFIRHGSPRRILAALFADKQPFKVADDTDDSGRQKDPEVASALLSRSLLTYLPLKFVLTLVSVVLPIPAGLFTPTFVIGGIYGRLVGEAIRALELIDIQIAPFEFAIIGAGAFSSGVTHAVSTAVIIMEISHNDGLNLPVSVAILASYFTAKCFSENVYDVLITTSQLPRLQKLPKAAYDIPIWEVMRDVHDAQFLTADSTYADARAVLARSNEPIYPIVDSKANLFLLATVTRTRLVAAVAYCERKMKENATRQRTSNSTSSQCCMEKEETEDSDAVASRPSTVSLLFKHSSSHSMDTEDAATPLPPLTPMISVPSYGTMEPVLRPRSATTTTTTTAGMQNGDDDDDDDDDDKEGDGAIDMDVAAAAAALHFDLRTDDSNNGSEWIDWPIHFAFRRGGKIMDWGTNELCPRTKLTVLINPSPFQLMEMTPMKRVDLLFRMLKLNNAYITRSGRLMGVISRGRLMAFLATTRKYRVPGVCSALAGCCGKMFERRTPAAGGAGGGGGGGGGTTASNKNYKLP